jgi:GH24 family phage-related lysozyme (muramidase)/nucleoid-associated protein YgaU/uncharacterized protein YbjQ (UPF0145 family)
MSPHEALPETGFNSGLDPISGLPGSVSDLSPDRLGHPLSKVPGAIAPPLFPLVKTDDKTDPGCSQNAAVTEAQTKINSASPVYGDEFESGILPIDYAAHLVGQAVDVVDKAVEASTPAIKNTVHQTFTHLIETARSSIATAQTQWNAPDNEFRNTVSTRASRAVGFLKHLAANLSSNPDVKEIADTALTFGHALAEKTGNAIQTAQEATDSWVEQLFDATYLENAAPNSDRPAISTSSASVGNSLQTQPFVGVIDTGFGRQEHGSQVAEVIQRTSQRTPDWLDEGVGSGHWAESLVKFVDAAKASGTAAIVNLSFDLTQINPDGSITTRSELTTAEQAALAYAHEKGVLVVASAGNQAGAISALGQARFDNLITVGAARGSDRADYSSYGKGLDLLAPDRINGSELTGTSLSAAEVTGIASKLWAANPQLSAQQVIESLETTAQDLSTPGWDAETGFGLLDESAAIARAEHTSPAPSVAANSQLLSTFKPTDQSGESDQVLFDLAELSLDGAVPSERANSTTAITVQPGDTLWGIAERELGNGSRWSDLSQANGKHFTEQEASQLQVGSEVYLPGTESTAAPNSTRSTQKETYQVQPGDTLWDIAQTQLGDGDRWRELRQADGRLFTEQEAKQLQVGALVDLPTSAANSTVNPGTVANQGTVNSAVPDDASVAETTAGQISSQGLELIKSFEGLRLNAYQDPGGVWTIGYGHTGSDVSPSDVLTKAGAETLLKQDLAKFENAVRESVSVPLNSNQFSALVSFTYNMGAGGLARSTLLERLNQKDYQGAANEFSKWVFAKGQKLPGLVRRRAEEKELFLTPVSSVSGNRPSTVTEGTVNSSVPSEHSVITVQPGDTLWNLAERELGDGDRWPEFQQADGSGFTEQEAGQLQVGTSVYLPEDTASNRSSAAALKRPYEDTLATDQTLQPAGRSNAQSASGTVNSSVSSGRSGLEVRVGAGDSLWQIAQRELGDGDRWPELRKADGSSFTEQDANRLQTGMAVFLPSGQPDNSKVNEPSSAADFRRAEEASWQQAQDLPSPPLPVSSNTPSVADMSSVEKLTEAFQRSVSRLDDEAGQKLKELLTPENLAIMAGTMAVWAASHGTPVGWLVDGALVGIGLFTIGTDIFEVGKDLVQFAKGALEANTEADLDESGQHLAEAIATVGIDVVVGILTRKALKGGSKEPTPVETSKPPAVDQDPGSAGLVYSGGRWRTPDGKYARDPNAPPSIGRDSSIPRRFMSEQLNTILTAIDQKGSHPLAFLVDPKTRNWRNRSPENREDVKESGVQAGHLVSFHSLENSEPERLAVEDAWYNWWSSLGESKGEIHTKKSIDIGGVIVEKNSAQYWENTGKLPKGTVSGAKEVEGWTAPG